MSGNREQRPAEAAAATENARLLELFSLQDDAGPCLDAIRTGRPVITADLRENAHRWPRLRGTRKS